MAKLNYKLGTTSVVLRVFLQDSSSTTGAGITSLTSSSAGLVVSTIADNEATPTVYAQGSSNIETITTLGTFATPTSGKCRFKEVDPTNHPGLYEIQIADARFAVSNARSLVVTVKGATNLMTANLEIQLAPSPANMTQISDDTTAADNLESAYDGTGYTDGTATGGASNSITLKVGSSATNDFFKGFLIQPVQGTGGGQAPRLCTAYDGGTRVATVTPAWTVTPDNTTTYVLQPFADIFRAVVIESAGSITAQQALSVILAALAGEWTAAGTFKTPNGASTRIAGTAAANAPFRSSITVTPSS